MAFYELRQYKVLPGKIDEWVKIMEQEIIPFQASKGMVICGSFRGETDQSVYVWLRRFESEAEREAQYKAVYESDHWKKRDCPAGFELPRPLGDGRDAHHPDREIDNAVGCTDHGSTATSRTTSGKQRSCFYRESTGVNFSFE